MFSTVGPPPLLPGLLHHLRQGFLCGTDGMDDHGFFQSICSIYPVIFFPHSHALGSLHWVLQSCLPGAFPACLFHQGSSGCGVPLCPVKTSLCCVSRQRSPHFFFESIPFFVRAVFAPQDLEKFLFSRMPCRMFFFWSGHKVCGSPLLRFPLSSFPVTNSPIPRFFHPVGFFFSVVNHSMTHVLLSGHFPPFTSCPPRSAASFSISFRFWADFFLSLPFPLLSGRTVIFFVHLQRAAFPWNSRALYCIFPSVQVFESPRFPRMCCALPASA